MTVRLQSPTEIRRAASWEEADGQAGYAEVVTDKGMTVDGAVLGGLYCTTSFGLGEERRKQMGFVELPWPCGHLWFTGKLQLAHAARLLGRPPLEVFGVRQYLQDVYAGEWAAASVWPLRKKYGADAPQVPAVGSPVAAAPTPVLRTWTLGDVPGEDPPCGPLAAGGSAQELVSVVRSAVGQHLSLEEVRAGEAFRCALAGALRAAELASEADRPASVTGAAIRLRLELPRLLADMYALARFQHLEEEEEQQDGETRLRDLAIDKTKKALPCLIRRIARSFQARGMELEDVDKLLQSSRLESCQGLRHETPLQVSVQRDLYKLWQTLTVPGFDGLLEEKLKEIQEVLEGQVESIDVARVLAATRRLQLRGHAALDVVLHAYAWAASGDAAGGSLGARELAAEAVEGDPAQCGRGAPPEVRCWYARELVPAEFHVEDVERLHDRMELGRAPRAVARRPATVPTSAVSAMLPVNRCPRRAGLARPRELRASGAELRAHGRGVELRWRVPLQDEARPGRAGGLHVLRPGQALPRQLGAEVLHFCAARPRPAGMAPAVPASMEAEGSLFVASGAAGLRHTLCAMEPFSRLQELHGCSLWLDSAMALARGLVIPPKASEMDRQVKQTKLIKIPEEVLEDTNARIAMLEAALSKFQLPEWMVFLDFPVLPPDLRMRSADLDQFPDDLNQLYKQVLKLSRNVLDALMNREPAGLLRYHKQALQTAVDQVLDNGRYFKPRESQANKVLESVSMRLKGKNGRMRLNMLGKRVNFSARTVIVVDPTLSLDECGLPFSVARTLFQVFLLAELGEKFPDLSKRTALAQFDLMDQGIQRELLERAMGDKHIILNRAPTLHRLSMQAFRPRLVQGLALKIHPLVCSPFNADFDGDTMTMHLALGEDAQKELKELMRPSMNLSSPATGAPVIGPTQDMVLGLYYLTVDPGISANPRRCQSLEELEAVAEACATGDVSHTLPLEVPRKLLLEASGSTARDAVEGAVEGAEAVMTTAGRLLLFLHVHRDYRPPRAREAALLGELDGVPLAPVPGGDQ